MCLSDKQIIKPLCEISIKAFKFCDPTFGRSQPITQHPARQLILFAKLMINASLPLMINAERWIVSKKSSEFNVAAIDTVDCAQREVERAGIGYRILCRAQQ